MKTIEKPATLVYRCKNCGHESIFQKGGKDLKDDFVHIKGENIFKNKTLCPVCKHDEFETDHKKDECPCMWCVEDRRNKK